MRRVLITGKTSFIGGRLAALLREHPEQYAVDQVSVRDGGEDVDSYVKAHGLEIVADDSAYEAILADVLKRCEKDVAAYKAGNQKVFVFLVGQAMKALKGKADPKKINELLRRALGE